MSKGDGKFSVALKDKMRKGEPKARAHSVGRFSLYFAILKGRFGRLMLINAITLLSALPLIAVVMYRYLALSAGEMTGPYGAGLGVGYPMVPTIVGLLEYGTFSQDLFFFALLIPASAILAVALSGGMYLCHNLVKTEGVYYFSDFKRGVKQNYFQVLFSVLLFMLLLYLVKTVDNVAVWQTAIGSPKWVSVLSRVVGYLFLGLLLMVCLWMISLSIGYKLGLWGLFKNAVILTVGTFPQTLFFAALTAAPVVLLLFCKGFLLVIFLLFFALVGFSFCMLIWVSYSGWVFDKYLTPEETHEEKMKRQKEENAARPLTKEELARLATAFERSVLLCRPLQKIDGGGEPFVFPESFSRKDLLSAQASRARLAGEAEEYAKAHAGDPRYLDFNKKWEEREEALPTKGKKRTKRPKMLGK